MESFKYQGTPEQMAKVADYLLSKGYKWWSKFNQGGPFLKCTLGDGDFFYANDKESYKDCCLSPMPAALELEIFGATDKSLISEELRNPWRENTGVMPVHGDILVDFVRRDETLDDYEDYSPPARELTWSFSPCDDCGDITHWRYHNVEDVPDYFVQPKTPEPQGRVIDMEEAIEIAKASAIPAGPIKSDGGSSSYYQLTIKTQDGEFNCETGDIIAAMVGDNFALGNAVKALRRIWQASLGVGKDGIDMDYDANKINYFVRDFINRSKL